MPNHKAAPLSKSFWKSKPSNGLMEIILPLVSVFTRPIRHLGTTPGYSTWVLHHGTILWYYTNSTPALQNRYGKMITNRLVWSFSYCLRLLLMRAAASMLLNASSYMQRAHSLASCYWISKGTAKLLKFSPGTNIMVNYSATILSSAKAHPFLLLVFLVPFLFLGHYF